MELSQHFLVALGGVCQRFDPRQVHIGLPSRQPQRTGGGTAEVEARPVLARLRRAVGLTQPVVVALKVHRTGLRPQLAAGSDELLSSFVSCLVGAFLADPLEVVLDPAGHDIDINATF